MQPHLKTGWPYDAVREVPRFMLHPAGGAKAASEDADAGTLLELTQKLSAQVAAQGAVIRYLLAASPHLKEIALQFLDTMDAVADAVDADAIGDFRAAHQSLHATMLLELNKRAAGRPKGR